MKYLFLYIALFAFSPLAAQITARVDVTFQNVKRTVIEKQSFFKFRKAQNNFETIKVDVNHYLINYLDSLPSVIYINDRPVLVSPGDSVQVTLKGLTSNYAQMIDTISAVGKNFQNYTFSNFFNSKLIKGDIFPDLRDVKYQRDSRLLYTDLLKAYDFRDRYYTSNFKKHAYQKDIPNFVKRMNNIEFLFNALSLSTELGENYKSQYPAFAKKIDEAFINTHFIATDTNYSSRMEEVFYAYFWHLSHVRFHPIESQNNTEALIKFITSYPDPFVRDYLVFFLATEAGKTSRKYAGAKIDELMRGVRNVNIITELKERI